MDCNPLSVSGPSLNRTTLYESTVQPKSEIFILQKEEVKMLIPSNINASFVKQIKYKAPNSAPLEVFSQLEEQ